jgi:Family of unknown function (DUF6152)
MRLKALGLAGIVIAVSAIPSVAHHSFAMFDAEKTVVLDGTVKEFQWTNPHSWILMMVDGVEGKSEQWAIEMGGAGRFGTTGLGTENAQARNEGQGGHSSTPRRDQRRPVHGGDSPRRNPDGKPECSSRR